ncbi:MAG: TadE/TadG family type IV pilus assembly protein, partial [Planctomycetaceae bacterium]
RRDRHASASPNRRGQSLILMFFIIVMLLGVMALTLDFGFVLLARRQMQTGVNSAALEGLRGQGLDDYDANSEEVRRMNAREMLRLNFDDDFDLSANNTTIGAGIDSSLIQGNGFRQTTIGPANTTLTEDLDNRSSFIFRPDAFELNEDNETHGDMVVGNYNSAATAHTESPDYSRTDFTPTAATPSSFLLRMRRTHNPDGLDEVPEVSSRGGGLPLLLGRAGWMRAEPADADYSVRRDGVLVRATAIASAVPARSVGVANRTLTPALIGLAPVAIQLADWQGLTTDTTYTLDPSNGELTDPADNSVVANVLRITETFPAFVGQVLADIESAWPDANLIPDGTSEPTYVPLTAQFSSSSTTVSEGVIVGFARIQLTRSGASFTLQPMNQIVAPENAVSLPALGWQAKITEALEVHNTVFAGLDTGQQAMVLGELIDQAFALSAATTNPLQSPAQQRAIR